MAKQSAAKAADDLVNDLDGKSAVTADELETTHDNPERATEVNEPQPEVPAAATKKPQGKPYVFNETTGVLTVNDRHGSFECSLMGVSPQIHWKLAAVGLASLLRGKADKEAVVKKIMAGQIGGKQKVRYPATVIAYAAVYGVSIEAAFTEWKQLDNVGKMTVRQSPRIRIALAQMAAERESHRGVDA